MNGDADGEAMSRLREGDDLALNEIMDRWQLRVTAFLVRTLSDPSTAVDLAQETFVRVYQHRDRYKPSGHFSSWLFAIAANLARQHQRWQRRHPTISIDAPVEDDIPVSEKIPSAKETPSQDAVRDEQAALVRKAIRELPHDLREALVLFEYEDMSYTGIATIVGCSVKAVETRIYRAKNILREKLASLS